MWVAFHHTGMIEFNQIMLRTRFGQYEEEKTLKTYPNLQTVSVPTLIIVLFHNSYFNCHCYFVETPYSGYHFYGDYLFAISSINFPHQPDFGNK